MTLTVNALQILAEGVAQQIAQLADPALQVAWSASGKYTTGQRGIYMVNVPTTPDQIIVLSPRRLTADPTLANAEYGLQLRVRGTIDPRTAWTLLSACGDVILGRWPTTLPNGLEIRSIDYAGGGSLGLDASNRLELAENYVYALGEHRARPF